jgi:integrase
MTPVNPGNERVKRRYFRYLKEARGLAATTINQAALAIADYEKFSGADDFKSFSSKRAIAYKRYLWSKGGKRAAQLSARATVHTKARQVQQFFRWLADQQGYRSRISHTDLDYLNPARRDAELSRVRLDKPAPTIEQVQQTIRAMPSSTDIALRNRALVAGALLTGARVAALASLKLKHVRADRLGIDQDARDVRTKFAKTQTTFFFPVGDDVRQLFLDYVDHLGMKLGWGKEDPLFPATARTVGQDHQFGWCGLSRDHWQTADPIREIFRRAFAKAGIPYFTPHTIRNCLTNWGQQVCRTPEEMKAWSQNLGHDEVLTTLTSYGRVPLQRQAELLRRPGERQEPERVEADLDRLLREVLAARSSPGS